MSKPIKMWAVIVCDKIAHLTIRRSRSDSWNAFCAGFKPSVIEKFEAQRKAGHLRLARVEVREVGVLRIGIDDRERALRISDGAVVEVVGS